MDNIIFTVLTFTSDFVGDCWDLRIVPFTGGATEFYLPLSYFTVPALDALCQKKVILY